jgi:hypothetical protein
MSSKRLTRAEKDAIWAPFCEGETELVDTRGDSDG